jgi:Uncharacterised conserved protein
MFYVPGFGGGSSSSSVAGANVASNLDPKTIEGFSRVCDILEQSTEISDPLLITEMTRLIAEVLIWAENQQLILYFDCFCEKNILYVFERLVTSRIGRIPKQQILQTLSMLVSNLKEPTSIFYLFSNHCLDRIIVGVGKICSNSRNSFGEEAIDEFVEYFVSLCKSIALTLNENTVNFFSQELQKFPLFTEIANFCDHKNGLVAASARFVVLRVLELTKNQLDLFPEEAFESHAAVLMVHLRECWNLSIKRNEESGEEHSFRRPSRHHHSAPTLQTALTTPSALSETSELSGSIAGTRQNNIEEIEDLLMYIEDLFGLDFEKVTNVLLEKFRSYVYLNALQPSLTGKEFHSESVKAVAQIMAVNSSTLGKEINLELVKNLWICKRCITKDNDILASLGVFASISYGPFDSLLVWFRYLFETNNLSAVIISAFRIVSKEKEETQQSSLIENSIIYCVDSLLQPANSSLLIDALTEIFLESPKLPAFLTLDDLRPQLFSSSHFSSPQTSPTAKLANTIRTLILLRRFQIPEEDDSFVSSLLSCVVANIALNSGSVPLENLVDLNQLKCTVDGEESIFYFHPDFLVVGSKIQIPLLHLAELKIQAVNQQLIQICVSTKQKTADSHPREFFIVFLDSKSAHSALIHLETRKIDLSTDTGNEIRDIVKLEYTRN